MSIAHPLAIKGVPEWILLCDAVDRILGRSPSGKRRKGWSFERAMDYATDLVRRAAAPAVRAEIRDLMTKRYGAHTVIPGGEAK